MSDSFDVHEGGQLRIATAGEQTSLLPLPNAQIPASSGAELASDGLAYVRARAEAIAAIHRGDYIDGGEIIHPHYWRIQCGCGETTVNGCGARSRSDCGLHRV